MRLSLRDRWHLLTAAFAGQMDLHPGSVGADMLTRIYPGATGEPPKRGTLQMLEAYSRSPWLRAVESKIASGIAAVQWKLYVIQRKGAPKAQRDVTLQKADYTTRKSLLAERERAGELKDIPEHIFLTALDRGNPYLTGQGNRKLIQVYIDLVGEAFLLKERNRMGKPQAFWPLPPDWVIDTPVPGNPQFRISYRGFQADVPATEMLWLVDPDPANPYGRGSGQAMAVADELDTDEFAAKHTRSFFANRARPDLVISPKGQNSTLTPDQTRRFEIEWTNRHQGFWRAFKPLFLSREVEIKELTQDFAALQLVELRQHERDMILQVTGGIPPEKLGIVANSNRATIEGADLIFAKDVLVPRLEFLRSYFQEFLVPEYDDRLIVDYVDPVSEDKDFKLKAMQAQPATVQVDEWRAMQGLPPMEDESGSYHILPMSATIAERLEVVEPEPLDPNPDEVVPPDADDADDDKED